MESERRLEFQELLQEVSGLEEEAVHFQPPSGTQMSYPAITYSRSRPETDFADNLKYRNSQGYTVTVIDYDPDNVIREKIANIRYSSFDRFYTADGLNHDVFTIFF